MKIDVILGLQWGDEGKGKIVDVFTPEYDIIARFQGGPNAGHTIIFGGRKFILHTIPSGIFHPSTLNVIGNGVIIDPLILFREIDGLREAGIDPALNLLVSRRAHLILPSHRLLDAAMEAAKGASKIGSTLKGIGPTYTDKYGRAGLRVGSIFQHDFNSRYEALKMRHLEQIKQLHFDISGHLLDSLSFDVYEAKWFDAIRRLRELRIIDSELFLNESLDKGMSVLAEGAQGTLLDVDFGSYPYVTSSNTITAGVCSGLGVAPKRLGKVYGVFKAYCTRVGSGPFPTELNDPTGEQLRTRGHEFGSTTGRPRRCGWLDLPALRYSVMINGVDSLVMMKSDVMNDLDQIEVCHHYLHDGQELSMIPFELDDPSIKPVYLRMEGWKSDIAACSTADALPAQFLEYIKLIEKETGIRVEIISTGPDRVETLRVAH